MIEHISLLYIPISVFITFLDNRLPANYVYTLFADGVEISLTVVSSRPLPFCLPRRACVEWYTVESFVFVGAQFSLWFVDNKIFLSPRSHSVRRAQ